MEWLVLRTSMLGWPDPPLNDGVVALRPLSPQDAEGIRLASEDAEISRWAGAPALYRGRPKRYLVIAERDRKAGRAVTPRWSLPISDSADRSP